MSSVVSMVCAWKWSWTKEDLEMVTVVAVMKKFSSRTVYSLMFNV